jgi:hypothetical protein
MAMDLANHPTERIPKVSICAFEGFFCVVNRLTHAMQIKMPEAASAPFEPVCPRSSTAAVTSCRALVSFPQAGVLAYPPQAGILVKHPPVGVPVKPPQTSVLVKPRPLIRPLHFIPPPYGQRARLRSELAEVNVSISSSHSTSLDNQHS